MLEKAKKPFTTVVIGVGKSISVLAHQHILLMEKIRADGIWRTTLNTLKPLLLTKATLKQKHSAPMTNSTNN